MAENLLILYPKDISATADPEAIEAILSECGFIGEAFDYQGQRHFRPGDEFMYLLTFLGCSPMISSGPDEDGESFVHIQIDGPTEAPRCLYGDNVKIPRCPGCGARIDDWPAALERWSETPEELWYCDTCESNHPVEKLRWKKCAAFGRIFIKVWGVFESEAIPNDNLKSALQRASGHDWLHAYLRHN